MIAPPQGCRAAAGLLDLAPRMDVEIYLFGQPQLFIFGIKTVQKIDYLKHAIWAAFGAKEGTFRLRKQGASQQAQHEDTIGALLDPNTFDISGRRILRLDVIPGDDFVSWSILNEVRSFVPDTVGLQGAGPDIPDSQAGP